MASPFYPTILRHPSSVRVHTDGDSHLVRTSRNQVWLSGDISVSTILSDGQLHIALGSPIQPVRAVELRWQQKIPEGMKYLGDHWERGYGDLSWMGMIPDRPLPWYFLASNGRDLHGCGVKTGAAAFCSWYVDPHGVTLWMDVRSGGVGVEVGRRRLEIATITERRSKPNETTCEAAHQFIAQLCDQPLLPKQPVYGANNSYSTYYHGSAKEILADSKLTSDLSGNTSNRPFSLINRGWEHWGDAKISPWQRGNERFPDMAGLAGKLKQAGARPGIHYRPLLSHADVPEAWILPSRATGNRETCILDPTVPEVLERIREDVQSLVEWGYELIKYDSTTHDLLGRWGEVMHHRVTDDHWRLADATLTNAEVLTSVYRTIREAAGETLLMGCNTVGHLCAGHVHIQRIGDNTSGCEWQRTRKMGINSLAFRAMQHGGLFATDADCVGMSSHIPWRLNEQWMELLAASGTSMFVSTPADYVKEKQKAALGRAYDRASRPQLLVQPIDWTENACPTRWKSGEEFLEFNWWKT